MEAGAPFLGGARRHCLCLPPVVTPLSPKYIFFFFSLETWSMSMKLGMQTDDASGNSDPVKFSANSTSQVKTYYYVPNDINVAR